MIKIDFLKNHPGALETLAQIWYQVLGQIWVPDVSIDRVKQRLSEHLNDNSLPLAFVALFDDKPVGMCSLRENDGIRPDLMPWLGSLVVNPEYQKQGIGEKLINATKEMAKKLDYQQLFLFAFDPTIPEYYQKLGWQKIACDEFKGHPVTVMGINL